ncbi:MAG: hypothetical protein OXR66_06940 [Candidatus Woesearchaeota archaeon]|nr:hypothetical protein [Candidatus Woesearchaeota archaeon]
MSYQSARVYESRSGTVVEVSGSMTRGSPTLNSFRDTLDALPEGVQAMLDLSSVSSIDAAGLGCLAAERLRTPSRVGDITRSPAVDAAAWSVPVIGRHI